MEKQWSVEDIIMPSFTFEAVAVALALRCV